MTRSQTFVLAGVVIVLTLVGTFVVLRSLVRVPGMAADALVERAVAKKEETVDLGAVVMRIQELSRLETASMRVMHVSTIRQSRGVIPDTFAGDEITFLAVGDVIAGIDLERLQREHIELEPDGTLVIQLPPAELLVSRVDNRQSRVMNRKTGMFRKQDTQLEGRVRAYAETEIRREATRRGILNLATRNGQKRMADLLNALGFERIRFETQSNQIRG
ncbi:MAG TPA: DUF4230 domain-containing protein [Thermoanaerobaculia bacterium]|nr:DUF4230 domain-containing protein [Thermoanaerobaculia bacterium]